MTSTFEIEPAPWADGTTVKVWPAVAQVDPSDEPHGSHVDSQTVASRSVTFDGLMERVSYVAYAGGISRRFVISAAADVPSNMNDRLSATETDLLVVQADLVTAQADLAAAEADLATAEATLASVGVSVGEVLDAAVNEEFVRDPVQTNPRWRASREIDARSHAADGATIDITALQAAYTAAGGTKVVRLPDGTHDLGTGRLTGTNRLLLKGDHPGACKLTFTPQADPASPAFLNGSVGAYSLLTANATFGDSVLTVASTSGWAAGDILHLKTTADFSAFEAGAKQGEFVKVATVDSATQITLRGHVRDNYTTANAASLAKSSLIDGSHIDGIGFEPVTAGGASSALMWLRWMRNLIVSNCEFAGHSGAGLKLDSVLKFDIEGIFAKDGKESSPFGYAIVVGGASQGGGVHDCHGETGHAIFTTSGSTLGGVPRDVKVSNGTASFMGDVPWHTHPACEDITFSDCQVVGARTEIETSIYPPAFHVAGRNCKIIDPTVNSVYGPGIYVDPAADGTIIRGGHIKSCRDGVLEGTGMDINGPNTKVMDYMVESCEHLGILVNAPGVRLLRGYVKAGGSNLISVAVNDPTDTCWVDDLVVEDALVGLQYIAPATPAAQVRGLRGINTTTLTNESSAILASTVL